MNKNLIDGKTILITGGTGSIGEDLIKTLLTDKSPERIRVFSRDETKQFNYFKPLCSKDGLFLSKDKIKKFLIDNSIISID